ncbi:MAG: hypothetical protein HZB40_07505 [Rhodocyclales bacterium]|nr:hypothetical protein [Rhodocyclales bacterium]
MDLLNKLLQVDLPCTVNDIRIDEQRNRVDIWIGIKAARSWFRGGRDSAALEERQWRHVNLGGYHCYVHAALPADIEIPEQPWLGDDKLGFTHAKAKQIFALLNEGVSYEGICGMLGVPFNDLWKFKYALENGGTKSRLGAKSHATPRSVREAAPTSSASPPARVPDATDPVWQELVEGRLPVDIRVLSLQLLLARLRTQFATIDDSEVRLLKLRDLHRYMTRNERVLDYELAQLRRH